LRFIDSSLRFRAEFRFESGSGHRQKLLDQTAALPQTSCACVPMPAGFGAGTMRVMFGSTYAVSWKGAGGRPCAGRLDMDGRALLLTGASNGCHVEEAVPFREIDGVRIEAGRLQVRRRNGRSLSIASLDAPGALRELAERLTAYVTA
jgi:hypothetical protein